MVLAVFFRYRSQDGFKLSRIFKYSAPRQQGRNRQYNIYHNQIKQKLFSIDLLFPKSYSCITSFYFAHLLQITFFIHSSLFHFKFFFSFIIFFSIYSPKEMTIMFIINGNVNQLILHIVILPIAENLMYILNDDTQYYPFCRFSA